MRLRGLVGVRVVVVIRPFFVGGDDVDEDGRDVNQFELKFEYIHAVVVVIVITRRGWRWRRWRRRPRRYGARGHRADDAVQAMRDARL